MKTRSHIVSLLLILVCSPALAQLNIPKLESMVVEKLKASHINPDTVLKQVGTAFRANAAADNRTALEQAEARAADAIREGDATNAKAWAEVAYHLRINQYLAPFGEITSMFSAQIKNLPQFIRAGMNAEAASSAGEKPSWSAAPFRMDSVQAILSNDVDAFQAALGRELVWNAVRQAADWSESASPETYAETVAWVRGGCVGTPARFVQDYPNGSVKLLAKAEKLRGLMTPQQNVSAK